MQLKGYNLTKIVRDGELWIHGIQVSWAPLIWMESGTEREEIIEDKTSVPLNKWDENFFFGAKFYDDGSSFYILLYLN